MEYSFIETIKVINGIFYHLDQHIMRIDRTSQHFYGKPIVIDFERLIIPKEVNQGIVKCRIIYGAKVHSVKFTPYTMPNIRTVMLIADDDIDYKYKYEDRSALNTLFSMRDKCDDILIIKDGVITDASFSNVVFKDPHGKLYTPSSPLLKGTKRAQLISEKRITERKIRVDDIPSYDGCYLINAMIDIEENIFIKSDHIFQNVK